MLPIIAYRARLIEKLVSFHFFELGCENLDN